MHFQVLKVLFLIDNVISICNHLRVVEVVCVFSLLLQDLCTFREHTLVEWEIRYPSN